MKPGEVCLSSTVKGYSSISWNALVQPLRNCSLVSIANLHICKMAAFPLGGIRQKICAFESFARLCDVRSFRSYFTLTWELIKTIYACYGMPVLQAEASHFYMWEGLVQEFQKFESLKFDRIMWCQNLLDFVMVSTFELVDLHVTSWFLRALLHGCCDFLLQTGDFKLSLGAKGCFSQFGGVTLPPS